MKKRSLPSACVDRAPSSVEAALEFWERVGNVAELWWSRHGGLDAADIAGQRLQALVAFARQASPFYKRLYADLPPAPRLETLPAVGKRQLLANFEDSCTDPRIRREGVERLLADRARIGTTLPRGYHVWQKSGTGGGPGILLQERRALAGDEARAA